MVGPSGPFGPTMGVMLDSIRYRLYAIESETSEPSGTMARIILEDAEDRLRLGGRPFARNGQAAIEALSRLEYAAKITIEGETDDAEDNHVKPVGGKRGRQARRITCRHGDETRTFQSAAKAAEWLRDDRQRPKASAAAIYAAISQNRTYAGYQWAYAHDNQPNVSRMV